VISDEENQGEEEDGEQDMIEEMSIQEKEDKPIKVILRKKIRE